MIASYPARSCRKRLTHLDRLGQLPRFDSTRVGYCPVLVQDTMSGALRKGINMGYGIGGVLILILVILAIIYFAKRV
jgi:hypothetical protein